LRGIGGEHGASVEDLGDRLASSQIRLAASLLLIRA
jgi:hypothetical protein